MRLPAEIRTFGHYFREAGYKTAIAGKWQLGKFDEHPHQPVEHGFDEYCLWTWIYQGKKSSRYYRPQLYRNGKIENGTASDFGPDFFCDFVLDFIDRHKQQPFFVYYPMALVHSPFIHPPKLESLARTNYTEDLSKPTQAFGHMITYMDHLIGTILDRLNKHGIAENTLVIFTGDNGTGKPITSRLAGFELQGGKGSMTEAGTRVPLIAWWPGKIKPSVREEFFCLVDVLPTLASVADIRLTRKVDGMNLAHYLTGGTGKDRDQILINYGKGYFVRDKRFRLNEDGQLYEIPVTSDRERYSEQKVVTGGYPEHRARLQATLNDFMAIQSEFKTSKSNSTRRRNRKKEL